MIKFFIILMILSLFPLTITWANDDEGQYDDQQMSEPLDEPHPSQVDEIPPPPDPEPIYDDTSYEGEG